MTKFEKCLWIVETLPHSDGLSLKKINEKWEWFDYCEKSMTERTSAVTKEAQTLTILRTRKMLKTICYIVIY